MTEEQLYAIAQAARVPIEDASPFWVATKVSDMAKERDDLLAEVRRLKAALAEATCPRCGSQADTCSRHGYLPDRATGVS